MDLHTTAWVLRTLRDSSTNPQRSTLEMAGRSNYWCTWHILISHHSWHSFFNCNTMMIFDCLTFLHCLTIYLTRCHAKRVAKRRDGSATSIRLHILIFPLLSRVRQSCMLGWIDLKSRWLLLLLLMVGYLRHCSQLFATLLLVSIIP